MGGALEFDKEVDENGQSECSSSWRDRLPEAEPAEK